MKFNIDKLISNFVVEAREHIKKINDGLLRTEKEPEDIESLNAVFGATHSIKGASNIVDLVAITKVAHNLEDALTALKEKKIGHTKGLSDLFFKGVDTISKLVEQAATGQEIKIDTDFENVCEELEKVAKRGFKDRELPGLENSEFAGDKIVSDDNAVPKFKKQEEDETIRVSAVKLEEITNLMGEMISNQNRLKNRIADIKEAEMLSEKITKLFDHFKEKSGFSVGNGQREEIMETIQSLYMKLQKLASKSSDDIYQQDILTWKLQDKSLKMRMLPLSTIFDTFHRAVRDMSRSLGKNIDFIVDGGKTELSKMIIEKIGNPLLHMLRNSIDHGIETPKDRIKAGKLEKGLIKLSASYAGRNVVLELSDDGKGIPLNKIKQKALQRKLFNEETLNKMPKSEAVNLIFHPGISTSAIITDISGRGVGMNIVKQIIIDQLKGSIHIDTEEGKGTRFLMELPLTIAIIQVLQITVSDMVFAVPMNSIYEILKINKNELIDVMDKKAIRLREQIITVVNLGALLSVPNAKQSDNDNLLIIIVYMGKKMLGLIVDSILDKEDAEIKSLPNIMKNVRMVTGVSISGNGEIVNVLDIPMLISVTEKVKDEKSFEKKEKKQINILVVEDSVTTREVEKNILESSGYKVDEAGDGVEALAKVKNYKYDLIIADVEMPRLDGFSLIEKLREKSEYQHIPIILVTSRDKEEDKKRGIEAGADAYITKSSFEQFKLLHTVENLVGFRKDQ